MANTAIDKVITQAKLLPEVEFHTFCNDLTSALYTTSPNACLASLRQLFLFLHSSHHQRCLPQQLVDGLVKLLLIPDAARWPTKLLSSLILAELAPAPEISLPLANLPWDDSQVPYVLTVARAQLPIKDSFLLAIIPQLTRWLSTVGSSAVVQGCTLAALDAIHRLHAQLVTCEQVSIVRSQLCCWLKEASLQQAANPYTRAIFRKDEAALPTVTELDGVATKNFFTVLCVGKYYTADQLMNIHTFSTLRSWIHVSSVLSLSQSNSSHSSRASTPSTDREERGGGPSSGGTATMPEASMQYALRLLEQYDRRPKMPQDTELQLAAMVEAIGLLDQLCLRDPSLIPRVFEAIKRVFNQYSTSRPRVLIPILQFFINHSEAVVYDPSQAYQNFFHTLGHSCHSTALAFDGMMFVRDNLAALCEAKLMQKFFPSLFKVLAWNPLCYTEDLMELLPACMSPSSTLEVIHRILDLPCLTATLELNLRANAKSDSNPTAQVRQSLIPLQCLKAFKDPEAVFIFKYVMNAEGGFGDTIDKLGQLHQMLGRMNRHPRVVCASEAVPALLEQALYVTLVEGDLQLSSNTIPVVLERARLLFNIPQFKAQIRSVLASYWLAVMEQYPQLVTDNLAEILEFISATHSQRDMEELNVHLLWTLGEYLSPRHSNKCSPEVLVQAYESLETVAYEIVQMNGRGYSARLITTLSATVAKLASRSQDLIARTVLCVSKLGQLASSGHLEGIAAAAVADRASELVNILKLPNVASMLLSPPDMDKQSWHRDVMKLPLLLQTTHSILQSTSGAVEEPGP